MTKHDLNHPLQIGVIADLDGSTERRVAYGRVIPIRTGRRGFELLVPGLQSNEQLYFFEWAGMNVKGSD